MISVYAGVKNIEKALSLYDEIKKENSHSRSSGPSHQAILSALIKAKQPQRALDIYRTLNGVEKNNPFIQTTMLNGFANLNEIETVKNLYNDMCYHKEVDISVHTAMLNAYAKTEQSKEAIELYEKIKHPSMDNYTYTVMVKVFGQAGQTVAAERLFKDKILSNRCPIQSYNTMLGVYAQVGGIEGAEHLYEIINHKRIANIISDITMLKTYQTAIETKPNELTHGFTHKNKDIIYRSDAIYEKIMNFRHIGNKDKITAHNIMLDIYSKSGKLESAMRVYDRILVEHKDSITYNTILKVYAKAELLDKAIELYETTIPGEKKTIVTHTTMLNVYAQAGQTEKSIALYHSINPKEATLITDLVFGKIILQKIKPIPYDLINTVLKRLIDHILEIKQPTTQLRYFHKHYRQYLGSILNIFQQFDELPTKDIQINRLKKDYKQTKNNLSDELHRYHTTNGFSGFTMKELSLLERNSKKYEPRYKKFSIGDIEILKENAFKFLSHGLQKLPVEKHLTIDIVNTRGQKIAEQKLNYSTYQAITGGQFAPYIIVKFDKHTTSRHLPVFMNYKGKIYRTDVFGGSKLKTQVSQDKFGELIAIPIEAGEFFKDWLNYNESFWYAQRAFLPEKPDEITQGLYGSMRIGVIPDNQNQKINQRFIVKDGFGYIKQSLANKMGLCKAIPPQKDLRERRQSYLTYQATHHFLQPDPDIRLAALDLAQQSIKRLNRSAQPHANQLYSHLTAACPAVMAVALPVHGDKLILPNTGKWREVAKGGIIIGRNPYDANILSYYEPRKIEYYDGVTEMTAIQYSLTGYAIGHGRYAPKHGNFFKGLLGIIPDEDWPEYYRDKDILVSSKDKKLNGGWQCGDHKKADQNAQNAEREKPFDKDKHYGEETNYLKQEEILEETLELNGVLIVKQVYQPGSFVGIPETTATRCAGDFDGDEYNLISAADYPNLVRLIEKHQGETMINPKITKTFTPRVNVGNITKIIELRKPILEDWSSIANVFNYLLPEQRTEFCHIMASNHILGALLGDDRGWHNRIGLKASSPSSSIQIISAEIQLGIKYGTDAFKSNIPIALLIARAKEYKAKLRLFNSNLSVPYGKGLRRRLTREIERNSKQRLAPLIANATKTSLITEKSSNLIDKAHRGITRYLTDAQRYEDDYMSD